MKTSRLPEYRATGTNGFTSFPELPAGYCPECEEYKPYDLRVANKMRCYQCAYGTYEQRNVTEE